MGQKLDEMGKFTHLKSEYDVFKPLRIGITQLVKPLIITPSECEKTLFKSLKVSFLVDIPIAIGSTMRPSIMNLDFHRYLSEWSCIF